jgi:hypothetical protein
MFMQAKLIITFSNLSEPDFHTKAGAIVTALRNNPDFPEPWPPQVPSFAQLEAAYNAYQDALHAAANRDRAKIAERDDKRAVLEGYLKTLAGYLELIAQGDTTKLIRTGFDQRKDIVRGVNANPPPAPAGFTVKHGKLSGSVILHASSVQGAASYDASHTEASPADDASWQDDGTFTGCNHIDITGLTPGKSYWFRLRAINSAGNGAWTAPAGLMVI